MSFLDDVSRPVFYFLVNLCEVLTDYSQAHHQDRARKQDQQNDGGEAFDRLTGQFPDCNQVDAVLWYPI